MQVIQALLPETLIHILNQSCVQLELFFTVNNKILHHLIMSHSKKSPNNCSRVGAAQWCHQSPGLSFCSNFSAHQLFISAISPNGHRGLLLPVAHPLTTIPREQYQTALLEHFHLFSEVKSFPEILHSQQGLLRCFWSDCYWLPLATKRWEGIWESEM